LNAINEESLDARNSSCAPIKLSKRELEIIAMIADGMTNKDIAQKLFLSTHTVMTHRKNIMNKLGVKNTAGIVIYAVKENVISPNKYLFAPTPLD
ncbi:MAG: helix-turn-helix transcriptional regulator, partial [Flavobacteriales bacterium]|nr:helix-turn-helix transcriptional regulator [Flavobacteriales bacterium]